MHDNHILNNGGYTVRINNYDSPNYTLDLTNNWWGTADSTQIAPGFETCTTIPSTTAR
jgi:hypothetical protein